MWSENKALARRYIALARGIALKHGLRLGQRLFCKKCNAPFIHGVNVKVRIGKERTVKWICIECGAIKRFGYTKKA